MLGFFSAPTLVATFDEPVAPGGPQVFVIGAPIEIAAPLEELGACVGASSAEGGYAPPIPSFP